MSVNLVKSAACPSQDEWLAEAKDSPEAGKAGMYLTHTGVVRQTSRANVRGGEADARPVTGMRFSYDEGRTEAAISEALASPGIYFLRVWLAGGMLGAGDTIMQIMVGGDIRPHVTDCLQKLLGTLKDECVTEEEII